MTWTPLQELRRYAQVPRRIWILSIFQQSCGLFQTDLLIDYCELGMLSDTVGTLRTYPALVTEAPANRLRRLAVSGVGIGGLTSLSSPLSSVMFQVQLCVLRLRLRCKEWYLQEHAGSNWWWWAMWWPSTHDESSETCRDALRLDVTWTAFVSTLALLLCLRWFVWSWWTRAK